MIKISNGGAIIRNGRFGGLVKGKKLFHKRLQNINLNLLENEINKGKSSIQISKILNISSQTVLKYTNLKLGQEYYNKLKINGKINKTAHAYKDGRSITRKYLKNSCEKCESKKNLQIHHKQVAKYTKNYSIYAEGGNHKPDNLQTLCASCHLKTHYRELNRFTFNRKALNVKDQNYISNNTR